MISTLYYRGFVYVVCGPRKKANSQTDADFVAPPV